MLSDLHAIRDVQALRPTASMNYAQVGGPRSLLALCLNTLSTRFPDGLDLLLVAGDMTDRAHDGPLQEVWADLHWLAQELGVPLIATSGNHDYDSRASHDPLPTKSLMSLEPPFPFGSVNDRNKYFAEQHAVYVDDRAIVVSANSAAHHGYITAGSAEHEHGRYSSIMPTFLHRSLSEQTGKPKFRIFLTHHHLNQLPNFDQEERSYSIGHEDVLRTLLDHGSWLVIHGHKHRGWIQYASGNGDAPPLVSASSFSADFGSGSFAEKVRHQFHVLELWPDEELEGVTGSRGIVHTWTHSDIGWRIAEAEEGLPGWTGFGWKVDVNALARRLARIVVREHSISGEELIALEPRIRFLTFDDQRRLREKLQFHEPPIAFFIENDGRIGELSLMESVS